VDRLTDWQLGRLRGMVLEYSIILRESIAWELDDIQLIADLLLEVIEEREREAQKSNQK
jgi:hypothetical protein